ncbi:MAG: chalcone isomerase family protein [Marinicellaceae bacterium]
MKFLFALILISNSVIAEKVKNIPQSLMVENIEYSLCKEYTVRYAFVVKIAYVGLYLKDCSTDENLLKLSDKLIRFNYQVNVKEKFFIDAAEEFFIKNLHQAGNTNNIQELNRFNQYYEDIESSDFYDLYHQQGQKLKLSKNNKLLGVSNDVNFGYKYFNIWFGDEPAIKPLKKAFIDK